MKPYFFRLLALATVLMLGAVTITPIRAEDLGAVKARMSQRLSQLDQFKTKGVIGENNRGFAELRGGGTDAGDVVAAENRDRGMVYAAIAKQTGTSAEQVGRARARQIAAGSARGVWLQHEDGSWYKK
jgi:uncharacterized protein YdbL (DUF1318 family)